MTTKTETCPRCAADMNEQTAPGGGALSRVDNATYICSACGEQEALFNMFRPGAPLPPVTQPIPGGYRHKVLGEREAVRTLTGFANETLDDLGGFAADFIRGNERDTIAKVFNFAVVLRAASAMPHDEDEYFERPWKWDREYQTWLRFDAPWPPEHGDTTQNRWDAFVNAVNDLEED